MRPRGSPAASSRSSTTTAGGGPTSIGGTGGWKARRTSGCSGSSRSSPRFTPGGDRVIGNKVAGLDMIRRAQKQYAEPSKLRQHNQIAIDSATRDLPPERAREMVEELAPLLDGGEPAFKKIDSLLRGHVALELAVCMRRFDHSRRHGLPVPGPDHSRCRQLARNGDGGVRPASIWQAELRAQGIVAHCAMRRPTPISMRSSLRDAVWPGACCGAAPAGSPARLLATDPVPRPCLPQPILALIGTDHPVSPLAQEPAARPSALRSASLTCCPEPTFGTKRASTYQHEPFSELLQRVGASWNPVCDRRPDPARPLRRYSASTWLRGMAK